MPANISGDYSKYPECIREIFPYVAGEVTELRQGWYIYKGLFMENRKYTEFMGERLGPLLGMFQMYVQDDLFLSIGRLTDKDSGRNANLSLWALLPIDLLTHEKNFGENASVELDGIYADAQNIRRHRHKRIAHFDLPTSLKQAPLPVVTFNEILALIEKIERFLNLFYWEFEQTTMFFDALYTDDIAGTAEVTAYKAKAYDQLEKEGVIPILEWRRRSEL